jgi:hypothetical protein
MVVTSSSEAVTFNYTQAGGFDFDTATTGSILQGTACCGAIEFFNNVTNFGGNQQYQTIAWGCESDGKAGSTDLASCAGGGGPSAPNVNVVTAADPVAGGTFSALQLNTFQGQISDNNTFVDLTELVHFNRVIDGDSRTLGTVSITAQLSLNPNPGGPFPNQNTIDIGFLETLNIAPCNETQNPLGSVCDDIFSVLTLGGFDPIPFTFNGQNFVMEFSLRPPCDNVIGTAPGEGGQGTIQIFQCNGDTFAINFDTLQVYASENQDSSIFVIARIRGVEVPGPATAVLVGLGLLGMGGVPRIRRRITGR